MARTEVETPVLVVGAGPTGLSTSIGLSRAGIGSVVVERHPGTSIHPKARGVNVRTMEIFRSWGIAADVRAAGLSAEENGFFFRGPALLAETFERWGGGGLAADASAFSPETWLVISQDALEPVLLEAACAASGSGVRFGQELTGLATDATGVTATIRDRTTGREWTIRAGWVVGADGADSRVRALAGIDLVGHGPLVHNVSIFFETPLGDRIDDRRSAVYYLTAHSSERPRGHPMSVGNPPDAGVILTVDNADRWLLVVADDSGTMDESTAVRCVHRALGRDDVPVRILGLMPWQPAARVAESYSRGRSFVAGDAAHQMTPSGAFGLNVGIGDAQNVAWKLGAVAAGWAGPSLLETYDAERRPFGAFATDQSYQQFLGTRPPKPFGNWGVILGARYDSAAVVDDGTAPAAVADPAVDYAPEAHPGARLPHAWLETPAGRRSTLDACGPGFTLMAASDADGWLLEADTAAARLDVPVASFRIGREGVPEEPARFEGLFGIGVRGAVIVRPDGHVAWRAAGPPEPGRPGLESVLRRVLGRDDG